MPQKLENFVIAYEDTEVKLVGFLVYMHFLLFISTFLKKKKNYFLKNVMISE